ncbi:DUF7619 domain-containing protein, partial [Streptomyces brasiliscabiei]|uniref:DUF7619 domain-containing protein n=1 Tax=Streptomyces brasiliscabiei TaxID=2736302 RepID=UPI003015301C
MLVLNFNNIMLPDSHTNMSLSTGFVKYYIYPKKNLHTGTRVSNSADIYFDYNAPVKTNTVFNTLGMPNGINEASIRS